MDVDRRTFSFALARHGATLSVIDASTSSFELAVDGIPQSQVSLDDPGLLDYPYVQQIGRLIDAAAPAGLPLRCVHLGAGALTLPRYVQHTRPGSEQVVVEAERELCEAVLDSLPLPEGHDIRLLFGDARRIAEMSTSGRGWSDGSTRGAAQAQFAVIDLWDAATVSAHVASHEFYWHVARLLAPGAVVAVNLLDGGPFDYVRGQVATLAAIYPHTAVVLDEAPHAGMRIGNVLIVASDEPLEAVLRPRLLAGTAEGAAEDGSEGGGDPVVLSGHRLRAWVGEAAVVTDATATDSPALT